MALFLWLKSLWSRLTSRWQDLTVPKLDTTLYDYYEKMHKDGYEPVYESKKVGDWPFTPEELKEWQDQWDRPYNPCAIDISICIPNGFVNRDGEIFRYELTGWKLTNGADRHGDGKPNGE